MPAYTGPAAFIILRVICAALLFFLVDRITQNRKPIQRKDYFQFFLLGLFGVAINQLLFFDGLSRTSNINTALTMTSTPILATLIVFLLMKEHEFLYLPPATVCNSYFLIRHTRAYQHDTRSRLCHDLHWCVFR